jgi:hypothetical protein
MSTRFIALPPPDDLRSFSPVENDPPLRWQRALHLAPPAGLGVGRRALVFALVTWVPIAIWALVRGHFFDAGAGESLLQHYGVHVRCLVAIPLLVSGEATLHNAALRYLPQFLKSGLVDDATRPRFESALRTAERWRDLSLPWLFVAGAALAWSLVDQPGTHDDAMSWAVEQSGRLGFGGLWFAYVARPLFVGLLLGWLWRLVLIALLFARLGRLGLSLVPSHPDRAGGLGFLERIPAAFAPVTLALSTLLASRWAHEIVHHGQTLNALKFPALVFVIVWSLVLLAPLATLAPVLHAAKRAALPSYAAMVAEQGRLVRRRWVDGTTKIDAPLLEPPGVGPVADAATLFAAVRSMRIIPIGRESAVGILVPMILPMLGVAMLQVPAGQLLAKLVKALM